MKKLTLGFSRNQATGDASVSLNNTETYTLTQDGGSAQPVRIEWSKALLELLENADKSTPDQATVQSLGKLLTALLPPQAWAVEEKNIDEALAKSEPVRITIRSAAEELFVLPWDLLTRKSSEYLCAQPKVLLRYASPDMHPQPEKSNPSPENGRILFAWADSEDEVPHAGHLSAIQKACDLGAIPFIPERDELKKVSVASLKKALSENPPVRVLHILCHGVPCQEKVKSYGLAWHDDEDGKKKNVVDARQLEQLLSPYAGHLRLVVLCACNSALIGSSGNPLGSPALTIHKAGIQSVLASRFVLSQTASGKYFDTFYRELFGQLASLEDAFLQARRRVLSECPEKLAWASMQLYARPEDGEDTRPMVFRPYLGLRPFEEKHARFFFGRDIEIDKTIAGIDELRKTQKPRFQIVSGASGIGKSSLIQAGVIPRLLKPQDESIKEPSSVVNLQQSLNYLKSVMVIRRDDDALKNAQKILESRLAALRGSLGTSWQAEILRPGKAGEDPRAALKLALEKGALQKNFLLVVDQFEEICTNMSDPTILQDFVRMLWKASTDAGPIHCILIMRSGVLDRCEKLILEEGKEQSLRQLASDEAHCVSLDQMGKEDLKKTIEKPAGKVGLVLGDGLAKQLLDEMADQPGALPLLEYTLERLWEKRDGRQLSWDGFNELGGVFGVLEKKADSVFDGLSPTDRELARRLLVQLVRVGDTAATDTPMRVPLQELRGRQQVSEETFTNLVSKLVGERLLVLSQVKSQVVLELAHKALINKWKKLRDWLDQDRAALVAVNKLEELVSTKKGKLEGSELGYATEILKKYPDWVKKETEQSIKDSERIEHKKAEDSRQQLLAMYVEQGRQLLLYGDTMRALLWLNRAYQEGSTAPSLPYLLAQAMRVLDGLRTAPKEGLRYQDGEGELVFSSDCSRVIHKRSEGNQPDTNIFEIWDVITGTQLCPVADKKGTIAAVVFSPDGSHVIIIGGDSSGEIRDVKTGIVKASLKGVQAGVNYAAFSPDGSRVVTRDQDGAIIVWDVSDGTEKGRPELESPGEVCVLNSDGTRLIAGGAMNLSIWDVSDVGSNAPKTTLDTSDASGLGWATFSPDGARVITNSWDRTALVWDAMSGAQVFRLIGHQNQVHSAVYSPDGRYIATVSSDRVKVWDAPTGKALISLLGNGKMLAAGFISSHVCRVAWTKDQATKLQDLAIDSLLWTLVGHTDEVATASFGPDGGRVLTVGVGSDGTARLWEASSGTLLRTLKVQGCTAGFSPDGPRILSTADDVVKLWDAGTGNLIERAFVGEEKVSAAGLSPDGRLVFTLSDENGVKFWDASAGMPLDRTLAGWDSSFKNASFGSDSRLFFTDDSIWDVTKGEQLFSLAKLKDAKADGETLYGACIGPAGPRAISSSSPDRFWDVTERKPLGPMIGTVRTVAISPDGRLMVNVPGAYHATSTADGAFVWDLTTGKRLFPLEGHLSDVIAAAFSPDSRRLATSSRDATAKIWDATTGRLLLSLEGHRGDVNTVAFSADGQRLVTSSYDHTAKIWDIHAETRTPKEIDALIRDRVPLRIEGEFIVPIEPDTESE